LGLSQETLAERANLHRTYISDVERGERNVSLENIVRLAHALDLSVAALFPGTEILNENVPPASRHGKDSHLVEVLLVEDDPDDVELTLRAFRKARFTNHVQVVGDGAQALDYIFARKTSAGRRAATIPQIILLDLHLPKVSGLAVLERLKADPRTRHIPVIILTVSNDSAIIAECDRLGADNFIVKPVDFQRLSKATPLLNLNWALLKPGK
jgi:CheY-like chemotaxis protein/DNA-binding XRE family transcriptional regulator